jgi:mRNA-degrading endonuclease RelE of RelBE toxin-antitoxin system
MYKVLIGKRVLKSINKMPSKIQDKLDLLLFDLREKGPERVEWTNYSKLNDNSYHCHLAYKWVACWRHDKKSIIIEVYYAGSRENAPY